MLPVGARGTSAARRQPDMKIRDGKDIKLGQSAPEHLSSKKIGPNQYHLLSSYYSDLPFHYIEKRYRDLGFINRRFV